MDLITSLRWLLDTGITYEAVRRLRREAFEQDDEIQWTTMETPLGVPIPAGWEPFAVYTEPQTDSYGNAGRPLVWQVCRRRVAS